GEALYEQTNSGQSGFSTAMKTFDSTRPIVASMATGIARAAYEYTLDIVKSEYPKQSHLFHQATDLLAEMASQISAARLLTYEVAGIAEFGLADAEAPAIRQAYDGEMSLKVYSGAVE